jgi:hypothetical protein
MTDSIYVPFGSDSVPPSTGVTTLTSLISIIRRRLGDTLQHGNMTETGDAAKTDFRLDDAPIVDLVVTVDDAVVSYSVDTDAGWVVFANAPAAEAVIAFAYTYYVWSEAHITQAVNDAVAELFGNFYVESCHDDIASTGAQEYVLQDGGHVDLPPSARVTTVEFWSDPSWVRLNGWSVRNTRTQKILRFENPLTPGYVMRVSFHSWPGFFTVGGDVLETTVGLPTRAKEPIVLLAMSALLGDRLGSRIRGDLGHNTQNENQIKSYEIQNDAAWYRSQAEYKARKLRMAPLRTRVVP